MLTVRDLSWHGGRERAETGHQQQTTRRQSGRRHLKSARMKIKTRAARVTCPSSRETIWLPPCGTQGFDSEDTAVNDRYGSLHRSSCYTRENREETRICKKLGVRLKLQGFSGLDQHTHTHTHTRTHTHTHTHTPPTDRA